MMWQAGLRMWPDDIDLLCSLLQEYYGAGNLHYNPQQASVIWDRLTKLPPNKATPYWRFWVFGAQYHIRILNDPATAIKLLDQGLQYVRRDSVMDVLRAYRSALVDSIPVQQLADPASLETYHKFIFETLEERLRRGLRLGVENGYVLAQDLAKLYQERAGVIAASVESNSQSISQQQVENYLGKALEFLTLAEKLYTGDSNHPIDQIYIARIRILMAQRAYNEALNLIRSLPRETREQDPSLVAMYRLALWATGGNPDAESAHSCEEEIQAAINGLFEPSGQNLKAFILSNRQAALVMLRALNELQQAADQEEQP